MANGKFYIKYFIRKFGKKAKKFGKREGWKIGFGESLMNESETNQFLMNKERKELINKNKKKR